MNQLYVQIGVAVGVLTLLGLLARAVRGLLRLALAGTQLVGAVGENTTATRELSDRLTTYQGETNARLEALEHRRFL